MRVGCDNCGGPRCSGVNCPNRPRHISAWQIVPGDLIDGRIVETAAIHECNEWLTVHVTFDDGPPNDYSYYLKVEVR